MPITRLSPEQLKEFDQRVTTDCGEVLRRSHQDPDSFGEDWYGNPAIFFRILLADDTRGDDQFVKGL